MTGSDPQQTLEKDVAYYAAYAPTSEVPFGKIVKYLLEQTRYEVGPTNTFEHRAKDQTFSLWRKGSVYVGFLRSEEVSLLTIEFGAGKPASLVDRVLKLCPELKEIDRDTELFQGYLDTQEPKDISYIPPTLH